MRFRIRSGRAVYLINRLTRGGVSLDNIERTPERLSFHTRAEDGRLVQKILREEGVDHRATGYSSTRDLFRGMFSRPFLWVSVLLSLFGVFFFGNFVYDCSISGNRAVNTETIAMVLRKNHFDGFTAKNSLDLIRIKREVASLDGVSFASVKIVGTRLFVEVKESLPDTLPEAPEYAPILSSHAAVVTRIVAESGTPRITVGQRVEAGALLIEPIYAFTEGGSPAPARGKVWGVVTHTKEIVVPAGSVEAVRTGNRTKRRALSLFGVLLGGGDAPPYETYDYAERIIFDSFGVSLVERTYAEIERRTIYHDFDLEGEKFLRDAATDLLLSLPCDALERGAMRVTQKKLDNMLHIVIYYTTEQRIDSLSLVP